MGLIIKFPLLWLLRERAGRRLQPVCARVDSDDCGVAATHKSGDRESRGPETASLSGHEEKRTKEERGKITEETGISICAQ